MLQKFPTCFRPAKANEFTKHSGKALDPSSAKVIFLQSRIQCVPANRIKTSLSVSVLALTLALAHF